MSKQSTRSKLSSRLPQIQSKITVVNASEPTPTLLEVGGFHINVRKLESYAPENMSALTSGRKKSHRSLGTNVSDKISVASFKVKQRKKIISTEATQKSEPKEQFYAEDF